MSIFMQLICETYYTSSRYDCPYAVWNAAYTMICTLKTSYLGAVYKRPVLPELWALCRMR